MNIFQSFSYSVKIAKKFGVYSALYLGYIVDAMEKQGKTQDAIVNSGFVYSSTGMTPQEQKVAKGVLVSNGIIAVRKVMNSNEKEYVSLNEKLLYESLEYNADEQIVEKKQKSERKQSGAKTKKECIIEALKENVGYDDNQQIKEKIFDWIDALFQCGKIMSKQGLLENIDILNKLPNDNKRLDVLSSAIRRGYIDLSWILSNDKSAKKDSCWSSYDDMRADRIETENGAF